MTWFLLWYSSKIKYLGAVEGFLVLSKDGCFERNIIEVSFSHMGNGGGGGGGGEGGRETGVGVGLG